MLPLIVLPLKTPAKFLISLENVNLDVSISPQKNRAAVGGSLENFILDRNFQSRSKSRNFLIFGPSGVEKLGRG